MTSGYPGKVTKRRERGEGIVKSEKWRARSEEFRVETGEEKEQ